MNLNDDSSEIYDNVVAVRAFLKRLNSKKSKVLTSEEIGEIAESINKLDDAAFRLSMLFS